MKTRAKNARTIGFDALESRLVLNGAYGANAMGNTLNGAYGANAMGYARHGAYGANARNEVIVQDMGTFYQQYSQTLPPLIQQYANDLNNAGNTSASSSAQAASQSASQADVTNIENAISGLVNGLATRLYQGLGQRSGGEIRALITGLPTNCGVTYPVNGPTGGSLLATLGSLNAPELDNLPLIANLTTAEVYALQNNGRGNLPTQPFTQFFSTYSTNITPLVNNYNTAGQAGDSAGLATAQTAIDNETRTDVYTLSSALTNQVGRRYATQIQTIITGTPGPLAGTIASSISNPNTNATATAGSLVGAPGAGSLLATLDSINPSYRSAPRVLANIVELYAMI